jgi:hypothetical protein
MPWNFNELDTGCPPQKEFYFYCELGPKPEKNISKGAKINEQKNLSFSPRTEKYCLNTLQPKNINIFRMKISATGTVIV